MQFWRHEPTMFPCLPAENKSHLSISSKPRLRTFYLTLVGREGQDFGWQHTHLLSPFLPIRVQPYTDILCNLQVDFQFLYSLQVVVLTFNEYHYIIDEFSISSRQYPLFLLRYLLMWTIFKVFIKFVTTYFLLYVLVFWPRGILAPLPGIKPASPTLEGKFLPTGPPGKGLGSTS